MCACSQQAAGQQPFTNTRPRLTRVPAASWTCLPPPGSDRWEFAQRCDTWTSKATRPKLRTLLPCHIHTSTLPRNTRLLLLLLPARTATCQTSTNRSCSTTKQAPKRQQAVSATAFGRGQWRARCLLCSGLRSRRLGYRRSNGAAGAEQCGQEAGHQNRGPV